MLLKKNKIMTNLRSNLFSKPSTGVDGVEKEVDPNSIMGKLAAMKAKRLENIP